MIRSFVDNVINFFRVLFGIKKVEEIQPETINILSVYPEIVHWNLKDKISINKIVGESYLSKIYMDLPYSKYELFNIFSDHIILLQKNSENTFKFYVKERVSANTVIAKYGDSLYEIKNLNLKEKVNPKDLDYYKALKEMKDIVDDANTVKRVKVEEQKEIVIDTISPTASTFSSTASSVQIVPPRPVELTYIGGYSGIPENYSGYSGRPLWSQLARIDALYDQYNKKRDMFETNMMARLNDFNDAFQKYKSIDEDEEVKKKEYYGEINKPKIKEVRTWYSDDRECYNKFIGFIIHEINKIMTEPEQMFLQIDVLMEKLKNYIDIAVKREAYVDEVFEFDVFTICSTFFKQKVVYFENLKREHNKVRSYYGENTLNFLSEQVDRMKELQEKFSNVS